jgi:hypothetical protein
MPIEETPTKKQPEVPGAQSFKSRLSNGFQKGQELLMSRCLPIYAILLAGAGPSVPG